MYYIGIDLGTSAVKLLLMDEKGNVKNIVSKEYPIYFPLNGWSEQNPEDWWNSTIDGIKELMTGVDRHQIAGISFGGQMHGLVILDEYDRIIRPAILWNDGRTTEEVEYLNEYIGSKMISFYTGNIAFAGFTAPKLIWLKKNEPRSFARISKIMLPKDFIAYRLTGVHSTDYSDASGTLMLDVKNKRWSKEMLRICEVDEKQMPKLFESYELTGYIKPEIAAYLDLPKECKIAAGAGDNAAAAIGTGTVGQGTCNISIGTSGTIFMPSTEFIADNNNAIHSFAHADGKHHLMGCMLCAASCNKWWMENILQDYDFERAQNSIQELGKNDIMFLPYLMGERSPHNDALAKGAFVGMTLETTRTEMTQAVLEGVAFAIRDSFEIAKKLELSTNETTICGGGAKSRLWKQIISNVLGIKVSSVTIEEGPAYGAAILALIADGVYGSVQEAVTDIVQKKDSIYPDEEVVALYDKQYQKYTMLYPALSEIFHVK